MAKQNQTTHSQHLNESHTFSIHFVIFFLLTLCCCFYSFVIFHRYLQTIGTFQTTSKIEQIACRFNNCFNSFYLLLFLSRFIFLYSRYSHQSIANHGQICAGFIRTVQLSDSPRRFSWCYQQEIVARNYQGTTFTIKHYKCCIHSSNTVSTRSHPSIHFNSNLFYSFNCEKKMNNSIDDPQWKRSRVKWIKIIEPWKIANDFILKWSTT